MCKLSFKWSYHSFWCWMKIIRKFKTNKNIENKQQRFSRKYVSGQNVCMQWCKANHRVVDCVCANCDIFPMVTFNYIHNYIYVCDHHQIHMETRYLLDCVSLSAFVCVSRAITSMNKIIIISIRADEWINWKKKRDNWNCWRYVCRVRGILRCAVHTHI